METENNCKKKNKKIASNFYVPPPARKSENVSRLMLNDQRSKDRSAEKLKTENENMKICNNSSLLFKSEETASHRVYSLPTLIKKKRKRKKNKTIKSDCNFENVREKTSVNQNSSLNKDYNIICVDKDCGNVSDSPVTSNMDMMSTKSDNRLSGNDSLTENEESLTAQSNLLGHEISNDCVKNSLDINSIVSSLDSSSENLLSDLTNHLNMNENLERILLDTENQLVCNEYGEDPKDSCECYKKCPIATTFVEETEFSLVDEGNSEFNDDWEKLLDEDLLNLVPKSPEVPGNITIMKKSLSCSEEKDVNDSSIIEIYGFPEEFKTQDIYASFSPYVNRGFQLKWVDNTHALGIFPSPIIADEVLNSCLPFVKTRPLSQATTLTKEKAKNLVLPSTSRPKTCSALARRLVSGALGVKAVFTQAEIQAEREMLKEAREQRRLAAKQRDAAWEGKF